MKYRTGYFRQTQTYLNAGYLPVSIARTNPITAIIGVTEHYFAPSDKLWEKDKKEDLSIEEYSRFYKSELDVEKVKSILSDLEQNCNDCDYKGVVFLCYEKDPNQCHRSVLGEYLKENFQIDVPEFDVIRDFVQECKSEIEEQER